MGDSSTISLRSHLGNLNYGWNCCDSAHNSRIVAKCGACLRCPYFLMPPQTYCNFALIVEQQNALKSQQISRQMFLALCQDLLHELLWRVCGVEGGPFKRMVPLQKYSTKKHKKAKKTLCSRGLRPLAHWTISRCMSNPNILVCLEGTGAASSLAACKVCGRLKKCCSLKGLNAVPDAIHV